MSFTSWLPSFRRVERREPESMAPKLSPSVAAVADFNRQRGEAAERSYLRHCLAMALDQPDEPEIIAAALKLTNRDEAQLQADVESARQFFAARREADQLDERKAADTRLHLEYMAARDTLEAAKEALKTAEANLLTVSSEWRGVSRLAESSRIAANHLRSPAMQRWEAVAGDIDDDAYFDDE